MNTLNIIKVLSIFVSVINIEFILKIKDNFKNGSLLKQ